MLGIVWIAIMVGSFVYACTTGSVAALGDALFDSASSCVTFILEIGAYMIMWSGFMNVAKTGGLTEKLAKFMSPVITRIFKGVKKGSEELKLICTNLSANMLGLSNAATPLGMSAMKKLSEKSINNTATNNMCMLAVINCASLQIVPSTLIAMRSAHDSVSAASITVPIWITSLITVIFAVLITKLCEGRDIHG
ncbi:MAG: hypothetical protein IJB70_08480 [Clostridia bacterium]|nr:hypothetical protein [Clostridia bacterium]